jgi:hypothetical protein
MLAVSIQINAVTKSSPIPTHPLAAKEQEEEEEKTKTKKQKKKKQTQKEKETKHLLNHLPVAAGTPNTPIPAI